MYSLQVKLLVTFAVVVVIAVWLATAAVPAVANPGSVGVSVTVRSSVALTVSDSVDSALPPAITLVSNVGCFTQTCVVVRGTTSIPVLTVVPSR